VFGNEPEQTLIGILHAVETTTREAVPLDDRAWLKATVVKRGASVGAGAIVLAGVTIGEFCLVGAGSIVTKNLPRHALAVGRPARGRGLGHIRPRV
jgi:acetyltransferase-like isoleucine patch superfamily enzyme